MTGCQTVIYESGISDSEHLQIDWIRLYNLVNLRDAYDGVIYRSKPGSLGNAPPYFVVVIERAGETYAVAETPAEGNATYLVAEKMAAGSWLEMLELTKRDARNSGDRRLIHSGSNGSAHLKKINNALTDLITVKP